MRTVVSETYEAVLNAVSDILCCQRYVNVNLVGAYNAHISCIVVVVSSMSKCRNDSQTFYSSISSRQQPTQGLALHAA